MFLASLTNLLLLFTGKAGFTSSSRLVVQASHTGNVPPFKPVIDGFTTDRKNRDQFTHTFALTFDQNKAIAKAALMMAALAIETVEQPLIFDVTGRVNGIKVQ